MTNSRNWTIKNNRLFDLINAKRRTLGRPPVDNATIATRLTLKYAASKTDEHSAINFSDSELRFNTASMDCLEKVINELFGLYLQNELARHCMAPARKAQHSPQPKPPTPAAPPPPSKQEKKSMGGRLRKLFGRS